MRYIKDLSFDTQKLLQRIYVKSSKHETREKAQCILLSFRGQNIRSLSSIFGIHINTIYNWFDNWESKKLLSLYHSKGQGRKSKISDDIITFISKKHLEDPKNIKSILVSLSEEKNINISKSTLKRALKKNFI